MMPQMLKVGLGARSYPIFIGAGLLDQVGARCRRAGLSGACLVVSDANVASLYGERVLNALRQADCSPQMIVVPAGERSKTFRTLEHLGRAAARAGLNRDSFVVALGGGVVGDLAGFFAATWQRGVALVQVPTTLLAMVDSSVGGKTGINLPEGKNLVGAFHQPALVVADVHTLSTLPLREYRSGLAEMVKYGAICDAAFFRTLEQHAADLARPGPSILETLIVRCCELKAGVVERDEREAGLRAILNFGHTFGHAIESHYRYRTYRHGEAVAAGIAVAAELSMRVAGLPSSSGNRLVMLLRRLGLPAAPPAVPWPALRRRLASDKKTQNRTPRFVLIRRLGRASPGWTAPEAVLREAWRAARNR